MSKQANKNQISLSGSVEIVGDFFYYAVNSILYQRGIYAPELFTTASEYNLTMLVTEDPILKDYLMIITKQVKEWLTTMSLKALVLVIKEINTNEVVERWQFNIESDKQLGESGIPVDRSVEDVKKKIQAIIRQITASVTYLPTLDVNCSIDVLVYADKDIVEPEHWETTGQAMIRNADHIKLRSFSTLIHSVNGVVSYRIV